MVPDGCRLSLSPASSLGYPAYALTALEPDTSPLSFSLTSAAIGGFFFEKNPTLPPPNLNNAVPTFGYFVTVVFRARDGSEQLFTSYSPCARARNLCVLGLCLDCFWR